MTARAAARAPRGGALARSGPSASSRLATHADKLAQACLSSYGRYVGSDCSIELRHGGLAHALDSHGARVAAAAVCFLLTASFAALAAAWINRVQPGKMGDPQGEQMQSFKSKGPSFRKGGV